MTLFKYFSFICTFFTAYADFSNKGGHFGNPTAQLNVGNSEECVPCGMIFKTLEKVKKIHVEVRGEPKSGTGMSFDWASGALSGSCAYMNRLFGNGSCVQQMNGNIYNPRSIVFKPSFGENGKCQCTEIDEISISISQREKHTLPVGKECPYKHNVGSTYIDTSGLSHNNNTICSFKDGKHVTNYHELIECMYEHQSDCNWNDESLQMAIFRDPRPVVISAYYHLKLNFKGEEGNLTLENFILKELPIMCQWLTIRYMLFSGLHYEKSEEFWYSEARNDPMEWHYKWLNFVGLQIPSSEVNFIKNRAIKNEFVFTYKKVDIHPGQKDNTTRNFEDEISSEMFEISNGILRQWLPPVILAKLGL